MQKGDKFIISYSEAFGIGDTTGWTPTVTATRPDGTSENCTSDTTTYDAATGKTTITAVTDITQAGSWLYTFLVATGTTYKFTRTVQRFAFHESIPNWIRGLMSRSQASLPDTVIESEYWSVVNRLYYHFPSLTTYDTMSATDRQRFERGAGLLAAVRMRLYTPKSFGVGEVVGFRIQQTEYKFAPSAGSNAATVEQEWFAEALAMLRMVTGIKELYDTRKTKHMSFRVSGPSRSRREDAAPTLYSDIASLLTDTVNFGVSE